MGVGFKGDFWGDLEGLREGFWGEKEALKKGNRDEMKNSAGVQGVNEGSKEHNLSSSVRLIDSRTAEGNNQKAESMKRLQG